ncbi:MAG: 3-methyl-2-oxobutanoate hydroxymethyltransferase, partial [Clostridia bacterium]|nr:3-methyl-2-oxobutanoate hydroxymethyltransferase [Clostridia bacterium]
IGAGNACDGQVLVYQDMLAMYSDFTPKFVKHFGNVGEEMKKSFKAYIDEVKNKLFPAEEHTFKIDKEVLEQCKL